MKLTCPLSGITYSTSVGFGSAQAIHPIFQQSGLRLVETHVSPLLASKLNPVELHLFGAACLRHLPVDIWNKPLASPTKLEKVWNQNILVLVNLVTKLDGRQYKSLPHYRVTRQTYRLDNLADYLTVLQKAVTEATSYSPMERAEYGMQYAGEKIFQIIRDTGSKLRDRNKLPALLAQWAAIAGDFPLTPYIEVDAATGMQRRITLRQHWKELIVRATYGMSSASELLGSTADQEDYQCCLDWCETKIPYQSLHADILLQYLRNAIEVLQEFRPKKVNAQDWIDSLRQETQVAAVPAVELSKPDSVAPRRNLFPNGVQYAKAVMRWQTAVLQYNESVKHRSAGQ